MEAPQPEKPTVLAHRPPKATVDGERLISVFSGLVAPLGAAFASSSEVILHDLSKLPDSIVAIHGDVTGRKPGDPATNYLLERVAANDFESMSNYETRLPDGRNLRSSTMIIRDVAGYPVAALCINTDISVWEEIKKLADAVLLHGGSPLHAVGPETNTRQAETGEWFPRSVEELAEHLIEEAVRDSGGKLGALKKDQKVRIVQTLQFKGFFMLKESVELIADRLGVTKFTIYNYLNEIAAGDEKAVTGATPTGT